MQSLRYYKDFKLILENRWLLQTKNQKYRSYLNSSYHDIRNLSKYIIVNCRTSQSVCRLQIQFVVLPK